MWSCRLESRECPQGGKENTDEPAAKRQRVDSDKNGDLAAKATQGHSQMTCSACTWENDSTAAHCEMCDTVLPAQKVFIVCCVLLRVISSHCRSQEEPADVNVTLEDARAMVETLVREHRGGSFAEVSCHTCTVS